MPEDLKKAINASIEWVKKEEFSPAGLPFRFEPGTPNITGAVSLLRALEYIEQI